MIDPQAASPDSVPPGASPLAPDTPAATSELSETPASSPLEEAAIATLPPERNPIAEWTITVLLLLFGTTTLVQAFVIPTGSMEDTLLIGDHLLVDKLAYAPSGALSRYLLPYTPVKRGDIIVFRYPVDVKQTFVKRVVGIPGDRLKIVAKQVFLNGRPLEEPYKYHKSPYIEDYKDNFPADPGTRVDDRALEMLDKHQSGDEIVVPPDCYFAMGDNRDFSLDSRFWGFVPRANIIGKPLLVYWSYDAPTDRLVNSGVDWDHLKDLARNFFQKTRWNRTFLLVRGHESQN